jgi:hypothetical protein
MSDFKLQLSHEEISFLLFVLESSRQTPEPEGACQEVCPVVESVEQLLCGGEISAEQQLVRHLNNHVREGLIECGMFELLAAVAPGDGDQRSIGEADKLQLANTKLSRWSCEIKLNESERRMIVEAIKRLPLSAWISMPRTLWILRRKLKST